MGERIGDFELYCLEEGIPPWSTDVSMFAYWFTWGAPYNFVDQFINPLRFIFYKFYCLLDIFLLL